MSLFPVQPSEVCAFDLLPVVSADQPRHGIYLRSNGAVKSTLGPATKVGVGGLLFNDEGALFVEYGVPVGTTYANGIPVSPAGAVCVEDTPAVSYNQGMPYTASGAIAGFIV